MPETKKSEIIGDEKPEATEGRAYTQQYSSRA